MENLTSKQRVNIILFLMAALVLLITAIVRDGHQRDRIADLERELATRPTLVIQPTDAQCLAWWVGHEDLNRVRKNLCTIIREREEK
ncbi:MAG: hypothetical protein E6R08_06275 [Nevskiaceae bacterium]|nr:MAG: hypothetical protein E6R08_06275 [Nevskiaceae bacterium]